MAKKDFKSGIVKPTDAQLFEVTKGVAFKKCCCGNSIISSANYCNECKRLVELGMKDPVPEFVQPNPSKDTQAPQSFPSDRHDGYQETNRYGKGPQPSKKFNPNKERP